MVAGLFSAADIAIDLRVAQHAQHPVIVLGALPRGMALAA